MKELKLVNTNRVALVDDADYDRVKNGSWRLHPNGYVMTGVNAIYLHNVIKPPPEGMENDHINRDPTDNRQQNLRHVTRAQNCHNSALRKDNTTLYKGVGRHKNKFRARIQTKEGRLMLGYFETAEAAALAYNEAAKKHFGEFAFLNTIKS